MRTAAFSNLGARTSTTPLQAKNIAVLDIGSSKISCLIAATTATKSAASSDALRNTKILGLGQTASRGIRAGAVTDIREAERAIRLAVDSAERSAGVSVSAVYVAISGGRPGTRTFTGRTIVRGVVTLGDVEATISMAVSAAMPGMRQVLHLHVLDHTLDGVNHVNNPIGLHGEALSSDVAVTTIDSAYLRNLSAAVTNAHLRVEGFVLSTRAAAHAAMTADERELGTIAIDIGAQSTGLAFIKHGQIVAADSIPLGGHDLTRDIAKGLATSLAHAERMKTLWGSAMTGGHVQREMLVVPILGERGADAVQRVPKSMLNGIMVCRLEEIFELCGRTLATAPFASAANARIVMTGGTSQLAGISDVAQKILNRPARVGHVAAVSGLGEHHRQPGFAVLAGSALAAARPDTQAAMPQEAETRLAEARLGYAQRLGRWLREAL